ncbi:unnamed protein product [Caenorhabditis auriculariae]|uniref:Uncharacterized protein n=1 Tax=Caenorhabditis auriculariae TaxID=2777116 RepID=A0A8S1H4X2_9PELO|nr:unnamed protein product [Caenorhabditis auriculariae]
MRIRRFKGNVIHLPKCANSFPLTSALSGSAPAAADSLKTPVRPEFRLAEATRTSTAPIRKRSRNSMGEEARNLPCPVLDFNICDSPQKKAAKAEDVVLVVVEQPAPIVVEQPAPVIVEQPAPVVVEQLVPDVVEQLAPEVVEQPTSPARSCIRPAGLRRLSWAPVRTPVRFSKKNDVVHRRLSL